MQRAFTKYLLDFQHLTRTLVHLHHLELTRLYCHRLFEKEKDNIMPNLEEFVDFDPEKDIPSLQGKVIFVTGGRPQKSEKLSENFTDIH